MSGYGRLLSAVNRNVSVNGVSCSPWARSTNGNLPVWSGTDRFCSPDLPDPSRCQHFLQHGEHDPIRTFWKRVS